MYQLRRLISLTACRIPPHTRRNPSQYALRGLSSSGNDDDEAHGRNFNWMDEAMTRVEVREASGLVDFDETHWEQFKSAGSVNETAELTARLSAMNEGHEEKFEVSEQFMRDMLELEGEDIVDILEIEEDDEDEVTGEIVNKMYMEVLRDDPAFIREHTVPPAESEMEASSGVTETTKKKSSSVPFGALMAEASAEQSRRKTGQATPLLSELPVNAKKPGFEKRVMRLESEMSNIVERVIAMRYPEWDKVRAYVVQVALSPNTRDLTVFYEVKEEVRKAKEWGKLVQQIAKGVRLEIAKLDIKYAPKVHFHCGNGGNGLGRVGELEEIFSRIAKDRV